MSFLFISLKKEITFNFSYNLQLTKNISWKAELGSEYWWQVKGCCKNIYNSSSSYGNEVCPPIKINSDCQNKAQYFQTLLSPSIQDLCEELKSNNWNWKICSIERWSKPAENEFVTSQDECNILESFDYKSVPACLDLSKDHEITEKIKFKDRVFFSKCTQNGCSGDVFIYYGSGGLTLYGNAEYPDIIFSASSLVSSLSTYDIEEKINFSVTSTIKEFNFSERYSNEYIPNLPLVQVPCADCVDMPNVLYVDNNLKNLNIMSSFLYENNYEIQDEISLKFNKTTGLWSSVNHYVSKFNNEKWKIVLDLGCSNEEGSDFYFWKFSLLFFYEKNNIKKETRLSLTVPDDFVCKYSKDYIVNFKYNLKNKYLFINYVAYYDNFYFIDNIGLFKSNYWVDNPDLIIKVTKDKIKNRINKKTIYY